MTQHETKILARLQAYATEFGDGEALTLLASIHHLVNLPLNESDLLGALADALHHRLYIQAGEPEKEPCSLEAVREWISRQDGVDSDLWDHEINPLLDRLEDGLRRAGIVVKEG